MITPDPIKVLSSDIKMCCADIYQSDWAKMLLGESFHPGGVALTEHIGKMLNLDAGMRVLDIASGQGTSAIHLAQVFGCHIVGVDYGATSVSDATIAAKQAGISHLATFLQGDAEHLPVPDGAFDAIICECAFCTFPDKPTAAAEFARVLRPGGYVGLSDLTRQGAMPTDLQGLLAWIACIADAQPIAEYIRLLSTAGFNIQEVEHHDETLGEMVRKIQSKLLGTELLAKLNKIVLPATMDFSHAKALAKSAASAIRDGVFGYVLVTATKPLDSTL